MLAILNDTFKPNVVQKFSSIKVCNALTLQILLYEVEILVKATCKSFEETIRQGRNRSVKV